MTSTKSSEAKFSKMTSVGGNGAKSIEERDCSVGNSEDSVEAESDEFCLWKAGGGAGGSSL